MDMLKSNNPNAAAAALIPAARGVQNLYLNLLARRIVSRTDGDKSVFFNKTANRYQMIQGGFRKVTIRGESVSERYQAVRDFESLWEIRRSVQHQIENELNQSKVWRGFLQVLDELGATPAETTRKLAEQSMALGEARWLVDKEILQLFITAGITQLTNGFENSFRNSTLGLLRSFAVRRIKIFGGVALRLEQGRMREVNELAHERNRQAREKIEKLKRIIANADFEGKQWVYKSSKRKASGAFFGASNDLLNKILITGDREPDLNGVLKFVYGARRVFAQTSKIGPEETRKQIETYLNKAEKIIDDSEWAWQFSENYLRNLVDWHAEPEAATARDIFQKNFLEFIQDHAIHEKRLKISWWYRLYRDVFVSPYLEREKKGEEREANSLHEALTDVLELLSLQKRAALLKSSLPKPVKSWIDEHLKQPDADLSELTDAKKKELWRVIEESRGLAPKSLPIASLRRSELRRFEMNVKVSPDLSYPVYLTRNVFDLANPILKEALRSEKVFVVLDEGVKHLQGPVKAYLDHHGIGHEVLLIAGGEETKNEETGEANVTRIQKAAEAFGLDRKNPMLVIGGGAVIDVTGFAASTFHRGAPLVRIPTTLLAQIDAGIGVKNGINRYGAKNFKGNFAPPRAVIDDPLLLKNLPTRQMISGLAEAIKVSLLKDAGYFAEIEKDYPEVLAKNFSEGGPALNIMWNSIRLHLEQIQTDPFETELARPLDYGHEWGHRLETVTHHRVTHGEGVAVGMAIDSYISFRRGFITEAELERILNLIRTVGLPIFHRDATEENLWPGLESFRAHLGGELTISLLDGIGKKKDVHDIQREELSEALRYLETEASRSDPPSRSEGRIHPDSKNRAEMRLPSEASTARASAPTEPRAELRADKTPASSQPDSKKPDSTVQRKLSVLKDTFEVWRMIVMMIGGGFISALIVGILAIVPVAGYFVLAISLKIWQAWADWREAPPTSRRFEMRNQFNPYDWVVKNQLKAISSEEKDRQALSVFFSNLLMALSSSLGTKEESLAKEQVGQALRYLSERWSQENNGDIGQWLATAAMSFTNLKSIKMKLFGLYALPEPYRWQALFYSILAMTNHIRNSDRHEPEKADGKIVYLDDVFLTGDPELGLDGVLLHYVAGLVERIKKQDPQLFEKVAAKSNSVQTTNEEIYIRALASALNPDVHFSPTRISRHYQTTDESQKKVADQRALFVTRLIEVLPDEKAILNQIWTKMLTHSWRASSLLPLNETRTIQAYSPANLLRSGPLKELAKVPSGNFLNPFLNVLADGKNKVWERQHFVDDEKDIRAALSKDLSIFRSEMRLAPVEPSAVVPPANERRRAELRNAKAWDQAVRNVIEDRVSPKARKESMIQIWSREFRIQSFAASVGAAKAVEKLVLAASQHLTKLQKRHQKIIAVYLGAVFLFIFSPFHLEPLLKLAQAHPQIFWIGTVALIVMVPVYSIWTLVQFIKFPTRLESWEELVGILEEHAIEIENEKQSLEQSRSEMRDAPAEDILQDSTERQTLKKKFYKTVTWGMVIWGLLEFASWASGIPFLFRAYMALNTVYWVSIPAGQILTSGLIAASTGAMTDYYTQLTSDYPAYKHHVRERFSFFMLVRFSIGVVTFFSNIHLIDRFQDPFVRFILGAIVGIIPSSLTAVYFNGYWNRKGIRAMEQEGKPHEDISHYTARKQWKKDVKSIFGRLPVVLMQHDAAQNVVPPYLRIPAIFIVGFFMQLFRNYMANSKNPKFDLPLYLKVNLPLALAFALAGGTWEATITAFSVSTITTIGAMEI